MHSHTLKAGKLSVQRHLLLITQVLVRTGDLNSSTESVRDIFSKRKSVGCDFAKPVGFAFS